VIVRPEQPADADAIRAVTQAAFAGRHYSSGTEAAIIDALRGAGALTISLVAEKGGAVVGHIAFSPVSIDGAASAWFGLGPVSAAPEWQGGGVGSALVTEGLARLRAQGAAGCVLIGDPRYYRRFGFERSASLTYPGAPAAYFQHIAFADARPSGAVAFHPAFDAS
jgi:putative acetyltransferase